MYIRIIFLISDEFNRKYYKKVIGCVFIGLTAFLEACDIRMDPNTKQTMAQFPHDRKVSFHGRFLNDGFLFFFSFFFLFLDESVNEIKEYFYIGNRVHPQIKFTFKISNNSINFLDTNVYKGKMFL